MTAFIKHAKVQFIKRNNYDLTIGKIIYFINKRRGGILMAVPARKTSKSKKKLRRAHQKLAKPEISYDESIGDYRRSHHVSLSGYYKGKKVSK